MKKICLLIVIFTSLQLKAQSFDEYFTDNTLRIDYIFSGDVNHQQIALDKLNCSPHWMESISD